MKTRLKIRLVSMLVLCILSSTLYSQFPARLQVFATSDKNKADSIRKDLDQLGYGPAEIAEENNMYKVFTKQYASRGEANLVKPKLAGEGYQDCFIVAQTDDRVSPQIRSPFGDTLPSVASLANFDQELFDITIVLTKQNRSSTAEVSRELTPEQSDLKRAFAYPNTRDGALQAITMLDNFIDKFPNSAHIKDAMISRGYRYISAEDFPMALRTFAKVAKQFPEDPVAGEATLRMGYLAIKMKDYAVALNLFESIASAQVVSEPHVRLEAMLRTAALYHRGKDLDAADACYAVIEDISQDQNISAFAAVHRAGLTLEKAWNGKATFQQAREQCDAILANRLNAPKSIRATACLMALETLAYEKKFDEMLRREAQARSELQNTPEAGLGNYWIAKARLETGDAEGAAEILEAITKPSEMTNNRFANVNVATQARRLAAEAHEKLGNKEKARQLLNER